MLRRLLVIAFVAALAAGGGRDALDAIADRVRDSSAGDPRTGRVVRVVDGDTIHVEVAGRREKVRYIGVDTPESVKPGSPVECFGKAAAAYNRRLVGGQRVRLVLDVEERDRYGRLLAYVHRARDGRMVNAALVRDGYATALTIAPNVRHAATFRRLAREAREAGRGLWARCRDYGT